MGGPPIDKNRMAFSRVALHLVHEQPSGPSARLPINPASGVPLAKVAQQVWNRALSNPRQRKSLPGADGSRQKIERQPDNLGIDNPRIRPIFGATFFKKTKRKYGRCSNRLQPQIATFGGRESSGERARLI